MKLADSLIQLAEEIQPQLRLTFYRRDDVDKKEYNNIHFEMQKFIATMRDNENMESVVARIDDDKAMVLLIALSEHDAMDGIVEALTKMAKKLAKNADLKLKVE